MKLAELRREMEDSTASRQRSSRLDKWREMTASAAAKNNIELEVPDKIESLGWKVWLLGMLGNFMASQIISMNLKESMCL